MILQFCHRAGSAAATVALSTLLTAGCASPRPRPVTLADPRLGPEETREVRSAMADALPSSGRPDPPTTARHGMRYADLDRALSAACAEFEMTVVRRTPLPDGDRFEIKTISDVRGDVIVRPTNDETVYDAKIRIGPFGNRPEQEAALHEALERWMRTYGRKRGWEDG